MSSQQTHTIKMQFVADTSAAQRSLQTLAQTLNNITAIDSTKTGFGLTTKMQGAIESAKTLQNVLQSAVNVDTGKLNLNQFMSGLSKAGTSVAALSSSLAGAGSLGTQAFTQLASAVARAEAPMRQMNATLAGMMTTLANTVKWQLSSSAIHGLMSGFSSAVGYVKDLNSSLNNIRIVTGQSVDDMARFALKANEAAKALSTTTNAYAKASLIYYQQGDSAAEAARKAEITLKAANASFNTSAEQMSEYLTAVWNSYQVGADELERYVDIMAALGAKTATSLEEIATSMQKVAATANTVGVSMEEVSSIISTVSSVTRESAESIGTSFKTIFARIGDLKLGETLEDGVGLGQVSSALKKINVEVLDSAGNMREMGDIITDLGNRWQTLSQAQKTATAQVVAGKRQYTQLMALFENWDQYNKSLNIAQNADGELQNQANIYATSWEGASNRVRAAWEGVWGQLFKDEALIKMTNTLADIVNGVGDVVKGFGGLQGVLVTVGNVMLSMFKNQLTANIDNAITKMHDFKASFEGLSKGEAFKSFFTQSTYQRNTKRVTAQLNAGLDTAKDQGQRRLDAMRAHGTEPSKALKDETYMLGEQYTATQRLLRAKNELVAMGPRLSQANQQVAQQAIENIDKEIQKMEDLKRVTSEARQERNTATSAASGTAAAQRYVQGHGLQNATDARAQALYNRKANQAMTTGFGQQFFSEQGNREGTQVAANIGGGAQGAVTAFADQTAVAQAYDEVLKEIEATEQKLQQVQGDSAKAMKQRNAIIQESQSKLKGMANAARQMGFDRVADQITIMADKLSRTNGVTDAAAQATNNWAASSGIAQNMMRILARELGITEQELNDIKAAAEKGSHGMIQLGGSAENTAGIWDRLNNSLKKNKQSIGQAITTITSQIMVAAQGFNSMKSFATSLDDANIGSILTSIGSAAMTMGQTIKTSLDLWGSHPIMAIILLVIQGAMLLAGFLSGQAEKAKEEKRKSDESARKAAVEQAAALKEEVNAIKELTTNFNTLLEQKRQGLDVDEELKNAAMELAAKYNITGAALNSLQGDYEEFVQAIRENGLEKQIAQGEIAVSTAKGAIQNHSALSDDQGAGGSFFDVGYDSDDYGAAVKAGYGGVDGGNVWSLWTNNAVITQELGEKISWSGKTGKKTNRDWFKEVGLEDSIIKDEGNLELLLSSQDTADYKIGVYKKLEKLYANLSEAGEGGSDLGIQISALLDTMSEEIEAYESAVESLGEMRIQLYANEWVGKKYDSTTHGVQEFAEDYVATYERVAAEIKKTYMSANDITDTNISNWTEEQQQEYQTKINNAMQTIVGSNSATAGYFSAITTLFNAYDSSMSKAKQALVHIIGSFQKLNLRLDEADIDAEMATIYQLTNGHGEQWSSYLISRNSEALLETLQQMTAALAELTLSDDMSYDEMKEFFTSYKTIREELLKNFGIQLKTFDELMLMPYEERVAYIKSIQSNSSSMLLKQAEANAVAASNRAATYWNTETDGSHSLIYNSEIARRMFADINMPSVLTGSLTRKDTGEVRHGVTEWTEDDWLAYENNFNRQMELDSTMLSYLFTTGEDGKTVVNKSGISIDPSRGIIVNGTVIPGSLEWLSTATGQAIVADWKKGTVNNLYTDTNARTTAAHGIALQDTFQIQGPVNTATATAARATYERYDSYHTAADTALTDEATAQDELAVTQALVQQTDSVINSIERLTKALSKLPDTLDEFEKVAEAFGMTLEELTNSTKEQRAQAYLNNSRSIKPTQEQFAITQYQHSQTGEIISEAEYDLLDVSDPNNWLFNEIQGTDWAAYSAARDQWIKGQTDAMSIVSQQDLDNLNTYNSTLAALTKTYQNFLQTGKLDSSTRQALLLAGITPESIQTIEDYEAAIEDLHEKAIQSAENLRTIVTNSTKDLDIEINWNFMTVGTTWVEFVASQTEEVQRYLLSDEGAWIQTFFEQWRTSSVQAETALDGFSAAAVKSSQASNELSATLKQQKEEWQKITEAAQSARTVLDSFAEDSNTITFASLAQLKQDIIDAGLELADFQNYINTILNPNSSQEQRDQATFDMKNKLLISELATLYDEALPYTSTTIKIESYLVNGNNTDSPILDSYDAKIRATITKTSGVAGPDTTEGRILNDALNDDGTGTVDGTASYEYTVQKGKSGAGEGTGEPNSFDQTVIGDATPDGGTAGTANYTYTVSPDGGNDTESTGTGVDYDREIAEDAATGSGGNADYTYTVRPDSSWTSIASSVIWGSTYGKIVEDILLGPDGKTGKTYTVTIQKGTATQQLTLSEQEWALIQRWMNATSDELNPDPINFALVFEDGMGEDWQTTVDNYITAWNAYIATHQANPLLFNLGFSQMGLIDEILKPDGNGGYVLDIGTLQLVYDLIPYDLKGNPKDSIAESMWAMVDTDKDGKIDEGMGGFLTYTYKLVYELEEDGETVKLDADGKPIIKNPDAIFGMYTNEDNQQEVMTAYQVYWRWAQDPNSHEGDPPVTGENAEQLLLNPNAAAIVYWAYINNQDKQADEDNPFLPDDETTLATYTIDWYYKYVNDGQPLENMIEDALAAEGLTPGTEQYQQRYGQLIGYTMSLGLDDSTLKDADALAAALTGRDWLEASKTYGIELDLTVDTSTADGQIGEFINEQQTNRKIVLGIEIDNMADKHFLETFAEIYNDPDRRFGAGMQQMIEDMVPYLPDSFFLSLGMDKEQFVQAMKEDPATYINKFGELLMKDADRGSAAYAILRDDEQQPIEFYTADRRMTRLHLDKATYGPEDFENHFNNIDINSLTPGSQASLYYIEDGLELLSSLIYQGRWDEARVLYGQLSGMADFDTVRTSLMQSKPELLTHINWAVENNFTDPSFTPTANGGARFDGYIEDNRTNYVYSMHNYVADSPKLWLNPAGATGAKEYENAFNNYTRPQRLSLYQGLSDTLFSPHPALTTRGVAYVDIAIDPGTGDAGGLGDGYAFGVSPYQKITAPFDDAMRARLIEIGPNLFFDPETQVVYTTTMGGDRLPNGKYANSRNPSLAVSVDPTVWQTAASEGVKTRTTVFGNSNLKNQIGFWHGAITGSDTSSLGMHTYNWIQSDIGLVRGGNLSSADYILKILPSMLMDAVSNGLINTSDPTNVYFQQGKAIMQFIVDGLTAGMSGFDDVWAKLKHLGLEGSLFYTLADIFEIHSPSHITQRIGRWIVLGLQKGIDDEAKTINFDSIEEAALDEIASLDQHLMDGIKGMTFPDMLERAFDVSDGIFDGINFSNDPNKNFIADLADGEITDLSQYSTIANIIARDKHNRFLNIAGLAGGNFAEGNPITKGAPQFGGIWRNAQLDNEGKLALVQYYNITPVGVDGAEIPLTLTLETGEANEELIEWLNSDATRDAVQAAYEADVYPSTLTAEDLTDGAIGALFDPTDEYYFANNSAISGKGRAAMQATFESVKASAENANNALIDAQGNIVDLDAFLPVFWEHWNTAGTQAMNKIESKWKELEDLWLSAVENAYKAEQERAQKVLDLWTSTFKTISKIYTELFGGKTISDIISTGSDDFTNWVTHGLANGQSFTNLMSMWWMNGSQVASQYTWDPAEHSMTDYQETTNPLDRNRFISRDTHGVPIYEASRARVNADIATYYSGNNTYKKLISDTVGESITEMLTTYNTAVALGDTTTAQIYGAILDTIIEGGTKDGQNNSGITKADEDGDGVFTYTIVDADAAETTTDTVRSQSNWETEVMSRFIQNRQFSSDEEWQQYQMEYFQNYLTQTGNLHKTQLAHYDAIISQNASDITLLDKFLDNDSSFTGFSPEDIRRIKELQAQYPTMTVEEIIETLVQGQTTASANKQDHENRLAMGWHWVEGADGTMQWVVPTVTTSAPTTVTVGEGDNATQITGTWTNDEEQAVATSNAAKLLGIDPALIGSGWFTNAPGQQTRYSWASDGNGGYILQQEVQTISYNTPDASVLPPINTSEYTEKDRKRIAENYGLEYAEVQNTMEILQESDALSNKPEEAFELAIQIERQDRAITELTSSWDTLTDAIDETNKGSIDYTKNIRKMLKLTEDLLGLDYGVLPESFLESEENLKLMEKAIKGDADALNELQVIAANAIAEQNGITLDESLAKTIAEDTTLEVGDTITYTPNVDNTALADSIGQMYMSAYNAAIAGGASVAEAMKIANDMMNAVGYNVEPVELEQVTYYANGVVPTGYEPGPSGNTWVGPNGEVLEGVTWSATEGEGYTTPITITRPKKASSPVGSSLNITRLSEGGSGIPKSGGGGGGGGKKKPTERKKYSEIERYHEIEGSLKAIENEMSKIEKLRERAFGPDKIKVLDAELRLLQRQKEAQEALAAEASKWLVSDQELLNSLVDGVEYLDDGRIANWSELQHQWIDEYNAAVAAADEMSDDEEKQEAIEAAQKEYDRKIEALENYEESLDKVLEAGLELEDLVNQISAKLLEKIQYNVEYKMELNESDLEIMEYYLDTFEDDVFKSAESMDNMMAQITTHLDNLQTLKEGYNELIKEYNNGAGLMTDADFQVGLKEFQSQIVDTLGELNELKKEMKEFYEDVLDNASEELENHTEKLDAIVETMESYISIQELMGKGVNYEWVTGIYQTQYEANRALLTANKQYLDTLIQARDEATDPDLIEAYNDAIIEANESLLESTEAVLETLQKIYENTIASIFDTLDKSLAGAADSVEELSEDYAYYQEVQERYVSTAKELHEVSKLNRDIEKSINETASQTNKNLLKQLQERIKAQSKMNELTQYDLDMNQKQYELLLAKIALEEAQNAKDTVRLVRDANGNYAYQYTADQGKIDEAEQKYEDALYAIHQLSAERIKEMEQEMIDARKTFLDSAKEIAEAEYDSEDERYEDLLKLFNQYKERMTYSYAEYEEAADHLGINAQSFAELFGVSVDEIYGGSSLMNEALGALFALGADATFEDAWTAIQAVMQAAKDREDAVKDATDEAGTSLDGMSGNANQASGAIGSLIGEITDLNTKLGAEFIEVNKVADAWLRLHEVLTSTSLDYEQIAENMQRLQEAIGTDGLGLVLGDLVINGDAMAGTQDTEDQIGYYDDDGVYHQYATGGLVDYTGPAWVDGTPDKPELMLNATDTPRFLEAIKIARQINFRRGFGDSSIGQYANIISDTLEASMAAMYDVMANSYHATDSAFRILSAIKSEPIDQVVTIDAHFPSVTNHTEIEDALNNLINQASHFTNRNF